ncbi:hypothetical protein HJG60_009337 [Phyllostomus discolor]|uniref:Uncharacterized protein n=1 Tax=Phyllostomus discolor TaxID=89673 RepID=A0A833YIX3_9CHIR|nr:hypothetical protein HJG60_009337 [Phyllostomus discolor]
MNPRLLGQVSAFPPHPAVASGSPGSRAAGSCSSAVRSGGPGWENPRRHLLSRPAEIWLPSHLPCWRPGSQTAPSPWSRMPGPRPKDPPAPGRLKLGGTALGLLSTPFPEKKGVHFLTPLNWGIVRPGK